jgi:putative membrane protein
MRFLLRLLITAAALWVAVQLVPGITYSGPLVNLLGVAIVFGLVNALIRPILVALTCPLIVLTLGLFVLVLNALMLLLTSALAEALGLQFNVAGIVPAFLGGLVVGITSAVLNLFVGDEKKKRD